MWLSQNSWTHASVSEVDCSSFYFLLFYDFICNLVLQKEIALYTASKFNTEFSWFDLDGDIDPLFKVMLNCFILP